MTSQFKIPVWCAAQVNAGNPVRVLAHIAALFVAAAVAVSCGGSGSQLPPPPPPVAVTISPTSSVAQSATSVQFTVQVANSANQAVVWQVNGVTGGNSSLGTISSSGVYTAPAVVTDSTDMSIVAVSQADATKSRPSDLVYAW
jgi:hypothetical protein